MTINQQIELTHQQISIILKQNLYLIQSIVNGDVDDVKAHSSSAEYIFYDFHYTPLHLAAYTRQAALLPYLMPKYARFLSVSGFSAIMCYFISSLPQIQPEVDFINLAHLEPVYSHPIQSIIANKDTKISYELPEQLKENDYIQPYQLKQLADNGDFRQNWKCTALTKAIIYNELSLCQQLIVQEDLCVNKQFTLDTQKIQPGALALDVARYLYQQQKISQQLFELINYSRESIACLECYRTGSSGFLVDKNSMAVKNIPVQKEKPVKTPKPPKEPKAKQQLKSKSKQPQNIENQITLTAEERETLAIEFEPVQIKVEIDHELFLRELLQYLQLNQNNYILVANNCFLKNEGEINEQTLKFIVKQLQKKRTGRFKVDLNKFMVEKAEVDIGRSMDLKEVSEYLRSGKITRDVQKFALGLWDFVK
ncbi:Ankyrin_repeat-containing domain superfamily [Hexamita inflata]|uniref:Ankyrin repeat-containing domain superfamily n=1 Tax=Hexamita inflata TaxID=28002 RepID=A0AA86UTX3_9EUKA|nr:Ankyrin repeat-containing domain superfamily [Hexamita inflata]